METWQSAKFTRIMAKTASRAVSGDARRGVQLDHESLQRQLRWESYLIPEGFCGCMEPFAAR